MERRTTRKRRKTMTMRKVCNKDQKNESHKDWQVEKAKLLGQRHNLCKCKTVLLTPKESVHSWSLYPGTWTDALRYEEKSRRNKGCNSAQAKGNLPSLSHEGDNIVRPCETNSGARSVHLTASGAQTLGSTLALSLNLLSPDRQRLFSCAGTSACKENDESAVWFVAATTLPAFVSGNGQLGCEILDRYRPYDVNTIFFRRNGP